MSNSNKTIKKRIFLSHISIIVISVVLTSLIFNICLNIYMRLQTRNQLVSAAQIIEKSMNTETFSGLKLNATGEDKEALKSILKINKFLKQTQTFLDINYAVTGVNDRIVFPREVTGEEESLLKNQIIPSLKKKGIINNQRKNGIVYFEADNKKYATLIHYITSENGKRLGSLILYSDLNNSRQLMVSANLILLSILLVTSLIALFVSNKVSNRISKPISQLSLYARKIGERDYKFQHLEYEEDEIGKLAKTMENMAEKLSIYDNTMKIFLQNASHELRTPLMSIQGYAEGIKHGIIDDKESAVNIIIEESKRLTNIVEDLLYLSKLDSQQETIKLESHQAEEFLRECIERVNGIALQKGIKLSLFLQQEDILIRADEEKLSRAVINILGNCLRYAKEEIKLTVEKQASNIIIKIEDDGQGFDTSELPNIFDRFFKGKGGKYGLGLSITKTIVEKHKGTITAENNLNGGACFKLMLLE